MRVRVNGNSFGDRFKVKTLFTPKFFLLAIRSVGGKDDANRTRQAQGTRVALLQLRSDM
jgi:hypothetical protein